MLDHADANEGGKTSEAYTWTKREVLCAMLCYHEWDEIPPDHCKESCPALDCSHWRM